MTAKEAKLHEFLAQPKTRFVIPIYQRNYDWTTKEVDNLLTDIRRIGVAQGEDAHFIGSIVFLHDGLYHTGTVKELEIIDGQQRLTTLSLIYAALYDIAIETGQEEQASELQELYLVNRFAKDGKEKLVLPANNAPTYGQVVNRSLAPHDIRYSRLRENYQHIRRGISSLDTVGVRAGLERLVFVEISLERGRDNPQRIFESLNSTGLELSQADLIRNYVLMGHPREEQERLFNEFWEPIERAARNAETNANLVSEFVRDYLTLETKGITRKNRVYETFKAYLDGTRAAGSSIHDTLARLKDYAQHYGTITNPTQVSERTLRHELEQIKLLEVNTATPFLLQVLEDHHKGALSLDALIEVLELVQTYVWRRFVVNLPTNALNKIFTTLYDSVRPGDYVASVAEALVRKRGTSSFPKNTEVRAIARERDFYNIRPKTRDYLFHRLENHNNREVVDLSTLTVEHIFPQNPNADWSDALEDAELVEFREQYLHRLGNLTLSGNNGALGNKGFLAKREMNVSQLEQGYAYSRLWLNRDLQRISAWTTEACEERTRVIVDRMIEVWPYPLVQLEDENERADLIALEDIGDPTGAQIADSTFGGDRIGAVTFARLYRTVLRRLYTRDAYRMRSPDIMELLSAGHDESVPRKAFTLADAYYVEMHHDTRTKVRNLRRLLTKLDLEGELELALVYERAPEVAAFE